MSLKLFEEYVAAIARADGVYDEYFDGVVEGMAQAISSLFSEEAALAYTDVATVAAKNYYTDERSHKVRAQHLRILYRASVERYELG